MYCNCIQDGSVEMNRAVLAVFSSLLASSILVSYFVKVNHNVILHCKIIVNRYTM